MWFVQPAGTQYELGGHGGLVPPAVGHVTVLYSSGTMALAQYNRQRLGMRNATRGLHSLRSKVQGKVSETSLTTA
jgi:hypothetical protein